MNNIALYTYVYLCCDKCLLCISKGVCGTPNLTGRLCDVYEPCIPFHNMGTNRVKCLAYITKLLFGMGLNFAFQHNDSKDESLDGLSAGAVVQR